MNEIGLALSCIDYRLFDDTIEFLKKDCNVKNFDHTILAGSSLGFNQKKYNCWPNTFIQHVQLAIDLHHIKKIVVIDHDDCGAYKLFYPDHHNERKLHIKNIKKFIKQMKKKFPDMIYSGYILHLDGSVEKVY